MEKQTVFICSVDGSIHGVFSCLETLHKHLDAMAEEISIDSLKELYERNKEDSETFFEVDDYLIEEFEVDAD